MATCKLGGLSDIVKKYTGSAEAGVAGLEQASAAGDELASIVTSHIAASGLSGIVATSGGATKVGKDTYRVVVTIGGDTYRPSLQPEKYGGIDNIAVLLNDGAAPAGRVRGVWHGQEILSRTPIPALGFIEDAMAEFAAGSPYEIVSLTRGA